MSKKWGIPFLFDLLTDAIRAAEQFGCDVIWGADLENGLPVPFFKWRYLDNYGWSLGFTAKDHHLFRFIADLILEYGSLKRH